VVQPSRDEVAAVEPLLIEIGDLLRSTAPLYCRGIATVLTLLRDGGSPLYLPDRRGALQDELEAIIHALEGRDQGASI
jgi:hypothetical protein